MKSFYKLICVSLFASFLLFPTTTFAQASISIDHVDSLYNGKIQPDMPLKFYLRWTNNTGFDMSGQTTGFRIYLSNNGVLENGTYEPPYFNDLLIGFPEMFDLVFAIYEETDGIGSDILGIGASKLAGPGLQDGFDQVVVNITTSVFSEHAGDSLCIDSTFYGGTGAWKWAGSGGDFIPNWGGPYCYEILSSCCINKRGNMNNSPDDQIDVADINILINYMFLMGVAPTCLEEGDFNGDGVIDIADLVAMVAYMFQLGMPPANCM